MIVKSMDDLRVAVERMARYNRLSLTALNDLANVGQGVLTRLRRREVKTRSTPGGTQRAIEADLKVSTLIKIVEAAGWELVFQPKQQQNRRARVLDAVRAQGGDTNTTPVVADLDS